MSPLVTDQRPIHSASRRWFASNELAELRIDLAQQSRNQKRDTYLTPKHTKSTKFTIKKYPDPFVSFANFVVRKSFVEWRIADKLRSENLRRPSAAKPQLNKRHRKSTLTSPPSRGRAERGPRAIAANNISSNNNGRPENLRGWSIQARNQRSFSKPDDGRRGEAVTGINRV